MIIHKNDSDGFSRLPWSIQKQVFAWMSALEPAMEAKAKDRRAILEKAAKELRRPYSTVLKKFYLVKTRGWKTLVDGRCIRKSY